MGQTASIVNPDYLTFFLAQGMVLPESPRPFSDSLLIRLLEMSPALLSSFNSVHSTVCRYSQFSEALDVSEAVVRGWVNSGYLPTITIGKYSFINIARYRADLLAGSVPASYK